MIEQLNLVKSDINMDHYIKNEGWKYTGRFQPMNGTPEVLEGIEKQIEASVSGRFLVVIGHKVKRRIYSMH